MRRPTGIARGIATVSLFAAFSLAMTQDAKPGKTPEQNRQQADDERNIARICARAKKKFEAADAPYQGAVRRGAGAEEIEKRKATRDAALQEYCACLRSAYAKADIPLPPEYETLCAGVSEVAPPPAPAPVVPPRGPWPPVEVPKPDPPPASEGALPGPEAVDTGPCADAAKEYKRARAAALRNWEDNWDAPGMDSSQRVTARLVRAAKAYIWCAEKHGGTLPPELVQLQADIAANPLWGGESVYGHPCSREWQAYQDAFIEHDLYSPSLVDGRIGAWRRFQTARDGLCECMRQRAPADYERLCVPQGYPAITATPPPGTTRTPTRTPTPGPSPTPTPQFVQAPWRPQQGMWANVSFSGVVHAAGSPDPHPAVAAGGAEVPWCRRVVTGQVLTISQVTATSFSLRFANLPGDLNCPGQPNGPVDCAGRFPGLFGSSGETVVRASGVTFANETVQGRIGVNSAASPFSANFSGRMVMP